MNNFNFFYKRILSCLFVLVLFSQVVQSQQSPTVLWAEQFGGALTDTAGYVTADAQGNIYTTGKFSGTVAFGNITLTSSLDNETFVLKTDTSGTVLWAEQFGSTVQTRIDTAGNIYTMGAFSGTVTFGNFTLTATQEGDNYFVVKYDASGIVLWAKQFTGDYLSANSMRMTTDTEGNVYTLGNFNNGTVDFEGTVLTAYPSVHSDIFVVKRDASGTVLWAKQFERTDSEQGSSVTSPSIVTDSEDNVYVSAYFINATFVYDNTTLSQTSSINGNWEEVFLVKLNPEGTLLWTNQYGQGQGSSTLGSRLFVDDEDNIYFSSGFIGTPIFGSFTLTSPFNYSVYAVKIDEEGTVVWANNFGDGNEHRRGTSIITDNGGNVYVSGYFRGTAVFDNITVNAVGGYDIFGVKINNSGNIEWAGSFGSTGDDFGSGISVDTVGDVYITGSFRDTITFGDTTLTSAGNTDAYLMKISSQNLAVTDYSNNQWKAYPNPAKDIVTLEFSEDVQDSKVEVFNTLGQKVKEFTVSGSTQNLSISELTQGMYLFRINNNGITETIKIYKQ